MSEKFRIYHNPRCSKSRETLQRLRDAGQEPEIIEYRKTGVSIPELTRLLKLLNVEAQEILRRKEKTYAESGLNATSSPSEILQAIHELPELLERPIVVAGNRAVIGRPPENVDELLD